MADSDSPMISKEVAGRRQNAIFESAVDVAVIATNRQGRITDWSPGAEKIFGWSADEMRDEPLDRLFTPEDQADERPADDIRRALMRGRISGEGWHLRKDGSRFWAGGEMMRLKGPDGTPFGVLMIVRDETLQRREAERLRVSENFLHNILASSDDCIQVVDLDGRLVFMNEGGRRAMEVDDFERLRGRHWPVACPDNVRADAEAAVAAAKAGLIGHYHGPTDTFAGTPKWWDVRVMPILDAQGRPEKLLAISRDITAAQQAEIRRVAILDLADRLRDMTDPAEMAFLAAQVMGRTLGASRAGFGTVEDAAETVFIERDWTAPGVESVRGTYAFRTFGSCIDDLKRGTAVAIEDAEQDRRTATDAGALAAIGIRSLVDLPIMEHGRLVAMFFIHGAGVSHWTAEQIAFVGNVGDRTWAAIERRKAETRLRDLNEQLEQRVDDRTRALTRSEARLQAYFNASPEYLSVLRLTAEGDLVYDDLNRACEALFGLPRDAVIGRRPAEVLNPQSAESVEFYAWEPGEACAMRSNARSGASLGWWPM